MEFSNNNNTNVNNNNCNIEIYNNTNQPPTRSSRLQTGPLIPSRQPNVNPQLQQNRQSSPNAVNSQERRNNQNTAARSVVGSNDRLYPNPYNVLNYNNDIISNRDSTYVSSNSELRDTPSVLTSFDIISENSSNISGPPLYYNPNNYSHVGQNSLQRHNHPNSISSPPQNVNSIPNNLPNNNEQNDDDTVTTVTLNTNINNNNNNSSSVISGNSYNEYPFDCDDIFGPNVYMTGLLDNSSIISNSSSWWTDNSSIDLAQNNLENTANFDDTHTNYINNEHSSFNGSETASLRRSRRDLENVNNLNHYIDGRPRARRRYNDNVPNNYDNDLLNFDTLSNENCDDTTTTTTEN